MQKTYQIKSTAIQNQQQLMDIAPAVGKAPASLQATPKARYELIDSNLKAAPDNIRVMRKGKNLFVFFEGDTAPGVVIEDFYQVHTDKQPKLIGRTDQGTLYEYTPENAAASALVSQLVDSGQSYGMALGGVELADATAAVAGLLPVAGVSPWLIGAGALGAAAAASGGGGGSGTSAGAPSVPNGGQALGLTIDADANDDGAINFKEKDNATTTSLSATFDKNKVAVGDTITFSDGTTTKSVVLTQAMLDVGKAVSTGWALPNEGSSLSVTASLKNAVGNATPVATDTAKIDTTLPNAGQAPGLSVDADTNGDGLLSAAEIAAGHATTSLTATFDPNTVAVGDTIIFSDGTTTKVVTLTAADVAAGKVTSAGWALPADGNTASLSASLKDAAGNPAPSTAQPIKTDATPPTNHDVALDLRITTDQNNDTWVNTTELNGKVTFTSRASFNGNAVVGDKIVFTASNGGTAQNSQTHTLTPQDITNGFVDVTFATPSNGALQKVTANYMDAAGNLASDSSQAPTDSATLDTTPPSNAGVNLAVAIATAGNDAWVNASELAGAGTLLSHATFNSSAVAGDKIVFSVTNGGVALPSLSHILTQTDIANQFVDASFTKPAEGAAQVVTANYVDAAGNEAPTPAPSDSATLDTVAAIIQSTPSVAAGHLNSLEFKSLTTENGHYTLNIGSQSFLSLPSTSALAGMGTVSAKDVWLDFWDAVGNQSTRAYLYDSASLTQITIDANTHISVLMA